jgi:phage-related protein
MLEETAMMCVPSGVLRNYRTITISIIARIALTWCTSNSTLSHVERGGAAHRFYRTPNGSEPVRDWLLSLPAEVRKEIGGDIRNVQQGWTLGKPYVDGFGHGLYEVRTSQRGDQFRVFFVIIEGTMVLLHGFQKKTQKTPAARSTWPAVARRRS